MLSDIFVPIIPAIVAGGLLMGINNILTSNLIHGQSIIALYPQWAGLATAINLFAAAPFTFLPVLIGFSAAKKFGGNPYLGAAMGMIMVHPDLMSAYQIGVGTPPVWDIFGLHISAIGYQGTVLPVLAVSWIIANIEKRLSQSHPVLARQPDHPTDLHPCYFLPDLHRRRTGSERGRKPSRRWNHLGIQLPWLHRRSTLRSCICADHTDRYAPQLHCD